jgi:hypothetical protein
MKTKPIKRIIIILESPNGRYYGFRFIRCRDGATCEARTNGGEGNILQGLANDGSKWFDDYFWTTKETREREIFALPYAGCSPEDIRKFVKKNLSTDVK